MRIGVEKSSSHQQSHSEIASDNPCSRQLFWKWASSCNRLTRCATTHDRSTSNIGLQIHAIGPFIAHEHGAFRCARINEAKFFKKPKTPLVPWVHVRNNRGNATRRSTAHDRANSLACNSRAPYTARKDESDFVGAPQSSLSYYHPLKQYDEVISRAGLICAKGVEHEFFGLCQRLGGTRPKPHCLRIGKNRISAIASSALKWRSTRRFVFIAGLVQSRFRANLTPTP